LATKIRLKRIGRRNRPFYRLIVIDSRKKRDGAAIEQIGWYNPIDPNNTFEINDERILHWLGEGAIPSNAVKKIMKREGLALRWHLMQEGVDEKEIDKEIKKWELNRENVLASRETKQAEKLAKEKEKPQSSEAAPEAEADKPAEDAGGDEQEAAPEAEADKPAEDAGGDEQEAAPEAEADKPAEEEPSDDAGEEE
jgi:small subunit ribosomal protein S16